MIKILFLINTLGGGGAERVMVNLINNMDKSKFNITVGTMFADGINKDLLCEDVKYYCKNKLGIRGLSNIVKYIPSSLLYKYYVGKEKYDIVVAYMHGAPTKVVSGCPNKKTKIVTWLHNGNPDKGSFFDFWFNEAAAIKSYASLDAVVGVSDSVTGAFSEYTGIKNTFTIYNTNDTKRILDMSKLPCDMDIKNTYPIVCSSGRLSNEKGFDRLINITSQLWREGLRFNLKILGEGPERNNLEYLIHKNNAEDFIELLGFCENPYSIMANSDIYILSSRTEGLATVITEALTLGLPVLSTEVSGSKEVLGYNNEYGMIVENSEEGIYQGLKRFLNDKELVEMYRGVAKARAVLFNTEYTVLKTEAFFENLLKNN